MPRTAQTVKSEDRTIPNPSLPSQRDGPLRKQGSAAISTRAAAQQAANAAKQLSISNHSLPSQRDGPLRRQGGAASSIRAAAQQAANAEKKRSVLNSSLPSQRDGPLRRQGGAASSIRADMKPRTTGLPPQITAKEPAADLAETPPQATAHKTHSKECWPALAGREGRFWTSQFLPHFAQ